MGYRCLMLLWATIIKHVLVTIDFTWFYHGLLTWSNNCPIVSFSSYALIDILPLVDDYYDSVPMGYRCLMLITIDDHG